jgi:hypothetical protein
MGCDRGQGRVPVSSTSEAVPSVQEGGFDLPLHDGCFKNPTRDRARIIGKATALTDLRTDDNPGKFGDRAFPLEVDVRIESLAPVGEGIAFASLVPRLSSIPKPENWPVYVRRSALVLTKEDSKRSDKLLSPYVGKPNDNIGATRNARASVCSERERLPPMEGFESRLGPKCRSQRFLRFAPLSHVGGRHGHLLIGVRSGRFKSCRW